MIKRMSAIFLIIALLLTIASCAPSGTESSELVYIEDIPLPDYKSGQTVTLNVYNWGEYISDGSEGSDDVNELFEEYFNTTLSAKYGGIKVKIEYSTYATNEDMYSKLKNSAVSYDIVIPSDYMIEKMANENMLLAFDTSSLSNYGNIEESFKNAYYDPENSFSVPYTYGMMGIIYNKAQVDAEDVEDKSWGLLWNEKYAGNILQFNNPRDAFATAMYWMGYDVNSTDLEVWNETLTLMKKQKPLLQGYVNDEIFNKMQSESALIAPYFVGDFLTMSEEEENLDFYYPSEGVNYFVDAMCIPSSSKNPHIAKEYINFMLGEDIAVANAEYIGYASPNSAVVNNPDYIESMGEYSYVDSEGNGAYELLYNNLPDVVNAKYNALFSEVEQPACYRNLQSDVQAHMNTLWESLKIEGSTELWVHITTFVIVGSVAVYAAVSFYLKKKRSAFYRKKK